MTKTTKAQARMLARIADNGDTPGMVPFQQVQADDRSATGTTWNVATKFALINAGLVKMNARGTLYLTRSGYQAIGREGEF